MAVVPNITPERRRLWELVAHGMVERVPYTTRRLAGQVHPDTGGCF